MDATTENGLDFIENTINVHKKKALLARHGLIAKLSKESSSIQENNKRSASLLDKSLIEQKICLQSLDNRLSAKVGTTKSIIDANVTLMSQYFEQALKIEAEMNEQPDLNIDDLLAQFTEALGLNKADETLARLARIDELYSKELEQQDADIASKKEKILSLQKRNDSVHREVRSLQETNIEIAEEIRLAKEEKEYKMLDQQKRDAALKEEISNEIQKQKERLKAIDEETAETMREVSREETLGKELNDALQEARKLWESRERKLAEELGDLENQLAAIATCTDLASLRCAVADEFWNDDLRNLAAKIEQLASKFSNDSEEDGEFSNLSFISESTCSSNDGENDWDTLLAVAKDKLTNLEAKVAAIQKRIDELRQEDSNLAQALFEQMELSKVELKALEKEKKAAMKSMEELNENKKKATILLAQYNLQLAEKEAAKRMEDVLARVSADLPAETERGRIEREAFLAATEHLADIIVLPTDNRRKIRSSKRNPPFDEEDFITPKNRYQFGERPATAGKRKKAQRTLTIDSDDDEIIRSQPLGGFRGVHEIPSSLRLELDLMQQKQEQQEVQKRDMERGHGSPVLNLQEFFDRTSDSSSSATSATGSVFGGVFSPLSNRMRSPSPPQFEEAHFSMMEHYAKFDEKTKKNKLKKQKQQQQSAAAKDKKKQPPKKKASPVGRVDVDESAVSENSPISDSGASPPDSITRRFSSDIFMDHNGSSDLSSGSSNSSMLVSPVRGGNRRQTGSDDDEEDDERGSEDTMMANSEEDELDQSDWGGDDF